jgi:hypothetical protein
MRRSSATGLGYRLTPGQFFTLTWDVAGKSTRIMRCISQIDTPYGGCVIEAVEDVYSTPATTYAVETTPTELALKAPLASPTFTGDPKAPTPSPGDNDTSIATTAFVTAAVAAGGAVTSVFGRTGAVVKVAGDYAVADITGAAPLASPTLTGDPKAPTPSPGDNDTSIATTAFVTAAIAAAGGTVGWHYSVSALNLANGDTADMVNVSHRPARCSSSPSPASRLAFHGVAEFVVPVQAFAGSPVWAIARPCTLRPLWKWHRPRSPAE